MDSNSRNSCVRSIDFQHLHSLYPPFGYSPSPRDEPCTCQLIHLPYVYFQEPFVSNDLNYAQAEEPSPRLWFLIAIELI
jgi:hypothetical protein